MKRTLWALAGFLLATGTCMVADASDGCWTQQILTSEGLKVCTICRYETYITTFCPSDDGDDE
jgi:hypothetical protein